MPGDTRFLFSSSGLLRAAAVVSALNFGPGSSVPGRAIWLKKGKTQRQGGYGCAQPLAV